MMAKYAAGEAEVHLEPKTKTTPIVELEVQGEEQNQAPKRNKQKRIELSKIKNQKTTKHSSQMKLNLSRGRI